MVRLEYSQVIMLEVVSRLNEVIKRPSTGKTVVMKIMYILQSFFGVKLGHSFSIYTYGPYASSVSGELEDLIHSGYIEASIYRYQDSPAYELKITEKGRTELEQHTHKIEGDDGRIAKTLELFGNKTAKELELDSTIIFLKNQYERNGWLKTDEDINDILASVKDIKPHFSDEEIRDAYDSLQSDLQSAVPALT